MLEIPTDIDTKRYQRFEAKYLISEGEALAIRSYIEPYTNPDPHSYQTGTYVVSSLYLDTPRLDMFWSSVMGDKNRLKLRIRTYGDETDTPVFFEIKRRVNDAVVKRRARVHRAITRSIIDKKVIVPTMLVRPNDTEMRNLRQFRYYMEASKAAPRIGVRYRREAYLDRQGLPLRITMDRDLRYLPTREFAPKAWTERDHWRSIIHVPVILEIKFTEAMPAWVVRFIQDFGLSRGPGKKYVTCMKALHEAYLPVGPSFGVLA